MRKNKKIIYLRDKDMKETELKEILMEYLTKKLINN